MDTWQRARRPEQKEARHSAILEAAAALCEEGSVKELRIQDIALRAGLAKGSIYRYFSTREEVLLALLLRELQAWFEALNAYLEQHEGSAEVEALTDFLIGQLMSRPLATRLLAHLSSDLEQNLSFEVARAVKQQLGGALHHTASLLERALPGLPTGGGVRYFLWLQALLTGLWPMAHPVGTLAEVHALPEFAGLKPHFETELRVAAEVMLQGLLQQGGMGTTGA